MSVRFFTKSSLAFPIASSYALRSLMPVSSRNGAKCSSSASRTAVLNDSTAVFVVSTPSSALAACFSSLANALTELFNSVACSFSFFFVYSKSLFVYCSLFLRSPIAFLRSSSRAAWLPDPLPASASSSSPRASSASFLDRSSSSFPSVNRPPARSVSPLVTPPVIVPAREMTAPPSVTALTRPSSPRRAPGGAKHISRATSRESHTTAFPTA
mmetsp:Transcript_11620/g.28571  ORF Transcript_11620/g.28571 Transcript_11620/m.28571 type:complete len:213 (-) Transcript_11620:610-1248(-)